MTLILPTLFCVNNDTDQPMTAWDRRSITTTRFSPPHRRQTRMVDAGMSDDGVGTWHQTVIHTSGITSSYRSACIR